MIMARSARSRSLCASPRYMNTVMKGAWPLVVIRVTTWYWMVCTPRLISSRRRRSVMSSIISSVTPGTPDSSSVTSPRSFLRLISTKGARWVREMDWPPYWQEATWAMIWVAMLQAVEKLWGFSIMVPLMTVPFCSISSRFTRSQLCICCAK